MKIEACSWPSDSYFKQLEEEIDPGHMRMFFEVVPVIDFRMTLHDGTVVSSQTLPSLCVQTDIPWRPEQDWFQGPHNATRRLHGYVNAVVKADVSWRARGIGPSGGFIDRHDANPESTGILVSNALAFRADRKKRSSAPGASDYEAARADMLAGFKRAFNLACEVEEGSDLDRALLSFGHSQTPVYADEQFVALWRTLEAATFCAGVRPQGRRRVPIVPLVASMVSKLSGSWSGEDIDRWHQVRNRLLHEGTTPELFIEVARYNSDLYECAEAVVDALMRSLGDHRPGAVAEP